MQKILLAALGVPEEPTPLAWPEATLRCIATGQVSTSFKNEESLAATHLAAALALAKRRPTYSPGALVAVMRRQPGLGHVPRVPVTTGVYPSDTLHLPNGQVCPLYPPAYSCRRALPPTRLIMWLPDAGMAATLRNSAARLATYQRQGAAVLLADLRGLGETADPAAFNDPKYYHQAYRDALLALHSGWPLLAQRVNDVRSLLLFIRNESNLFSLPLLLRADGRAALVA